MKDTFIKNTFVLVVSGILVKALGLANRIVITRMLGTEGIGLYMMSFPTILLFITLSQLGMPIAISKLISENKISKRLKNSEIILNSIFISVMVSSLLIMVLLIIVKPLSNNWLGNPDTYYPILTTIILIPLVSFSGILKGYLHGLKLMNITSYSHIIEQITRITISIMVVYFMLPYGLVIAVTASLIAMSFGELLAISYMLLKIRKIAPNAHIKLQITSDSKDILEIAIPSTSSRLVGSLTYFFEPIIFSFALRNYLNSDTINNVYGNITGFAISLLLIPSFFTHAISTALLPSISESYSKKDFKRLDKLFRSSMLLIFIPSGLIAIILTFYSYEFMNLLFRTTNGANYASYMAPFFFVFYFQAPIISILHGLNKSKIVMVNSILISILKLALIFLLSSNTTINSHGLPIASILSTTLLTFINFRILAITINVKTSFLTLTKMITIITVSLLALLFFKEHNMNYLKSTLIVSCIYLLLVHGLNLLKFNSLFKALKN
ncbi:polysaccharide biosynthesis protein [Mycoplasmatota bacterium WC44]